ncbi:hypothetical protein K474DRAFT_815938 [Panus rudis PR-1116 ss-1]|nr:hypothetical protein K474DRAFT_815938 [Panus rudis PR-1116 ss-1]
MRSTVFVTFVLASIACSTTSAIPLSDNLGQNTAADTEVHLPSELLARGYHVGARVTFDDLVPQYHSEARREFDGGVSDDHVREAIIHVLKKRGPRSKPNLNVNTDPRRPPGRSWSVSSSSSSEGPITPTDVVQSNPAVAYVMGRNPPIQMPYQNVPRPRPQQPPQNVAATGRNFQGQQQPPQNVATTGRNFQGQGNPVPMTPARMPTNSGPQMQPPPRTNTQAQYGANTSSRTGGRTNNSGPQSQPPRTNTQAQWGANSRTGGRTNGDSRYLPPGSGQAGQPRY